MSDFARRKKYAWIVLASGVGGTLMFVLMCAFDGPLDSFDGIYLWPICTTAAAAASALLLKKYYREEPEPFSGFWHLSIIELIAISFFAAALMTGWHAAWPSTFVPAGIPVTLSLAAAFAFCLLFAARKGFQLQQAKITKALSMLLISLGWMTFCSLVALFVFLLCYGRQLDIAVDFLAVVFGLTGHSEKNYWLLYSFRIGLLCLPLGYAFGVLLHFLVSPRK